MSTSTHATLPAAAPRAEAPQPPPPDLSVVIVSWNTRPELRTCLASVFAGLGATSAQVVVVDNDSDDGSADMVEAEFPAAVVVRNPANVGFATACNVGLSVADGRIVLLLNPDTRVLGDVLPATVAYLDARPDVGAMGCRVLTPGGDVSPTCFRDPSVLNTALGVTGLAHLPWPAWLGRERMTRWRRDSERDVDVVTGCYLAVPRRVIDAVGGLDEGYFFCGEESDWCRQIRAAGGRCGSHRSATSSTPRAWRAPRSITTASSCSTPASCATPAATTAGWPGGRCGPSAGCSRRAAARRGRSSRRPGATGPAGRTPAPGATTSPGSCVTSPR